MAYKFSLERVRRGYGVLLRFLIRQKWLVLIAFVAVRMYRSVDNTESVSEPVTSELAPDGAVAVATKQSVAARPGLDLSASSIAKLAGAATAVGLLTGLFGVGGGFAVVPALALLLKFPAKEAIGTSLVVIVINAAIALGMRSGDLGFDWMIVGPFLVTVTVGVVVGTHIAKGIDANRLTRAFALMLGAVAIYTATSTVLTA